MNPSEVQARMKSRIWKAIAQNDFDISGMDKNQFEELVDIAVNAALLEMDHQMVDTMLEEKSLVGSEFQETAKEDSDQETGQENILWEGHPFLSIVEQYKITDELIRISRGLFGRSHENIELVRIQDLNYKQSMGERLFQLGDIQITSHDPHSPQIALRNVKDPEGVYNILRRAVQQARKANKLSYQEEM